MSDQINHPTHYGGDTAYEAIKVIEAWKLGFCLGNTVKYIARAERKGAALEDLKKARWYLEREIDMRLRDVQKMPQPSGEGEILEKMGEQPSIESDTIASNG